ncbi:MAG: biotin/lipoyl-binding protein, partial [Pseudomonadota bacterium]
MNDTGVIAADTATGSIPRGWSDLAERAVIEQEPLRARTLLYGVSLAVVCLIAWAAVGEVDEVTRGQGKVIPSRQVQILGSQDGGIIRELLVREGDKVERGALLLRLDETRSQASLGENRAELIGLSVRASRLQAVVEGTRFEPTTEMRAAAAASVKQEQSLFDSTLAEIQVQQEIARGQLAQRGEELSELKAREDQLDTERA